MSAQQKKNSSKSTPTSKASASKAGKILSNPNSSKKAKSEAASKLAKRVRTVQEPAKKGSITKAKANSVVKSVLKSKKKK